MNETKVPERYNIRVYGVCIDLEGRVLLTDERRGGMEMTKFPGGGHHFGEGLAEALHREFMEELNSEIEIVGLLYINDFLQISAFNPKDQLLSIYYLIRFVGALNFETHQKSCDFPMDAADAQIFRWVSLADLGDTKFTFPVDKVVASKLLENANAFTNLRMGEG
jgi:8-oxo-dGTP diphosphatase